MKTLICLLLVSLALPDLSVVRSDFLRSVESEDVAEKLFDRLESSTTATPTHYAYKGAVWAVRAKHAYMVNTKLSYVKKGLRILDQAVKSAPANTEIRYLRFSIEVNIPGFLGLSPHVKSDQRHLVSKLLNGQHQLNKKMFNLIRDFVLENAELEQSTKIRLKNAKP